MSCPDTTLIVDLTLVLDTRPHETLRHLVDCPRCRATLEAASRIRHLGVTEAMHPGFTDTVLEACAQHDGDDRGANRGRPGWWAAHVALVGATAFAASVLAGTTAEIRPGPWALALSILAGAAVAFVQRRSGGSPGPAGPAA